jgi:DNA-binding NtrC family response regulator
MTERAVPNMSPHILVADDERSIRLMLEAGLRLHGFHVTVVSTGSRALEVTRNGGIDAVLSDIYMPDGGGLDLVRDLRGIDAAIPIILMTAQGSVEAAVRAMAEDATDFIGKPFDVAAVVELLRRHLGARKQAALDQAASSVESFISRSGLAGRSAPMVMVYKLVAQAARCDETVLILGESGTGKELVARAIHDFSSRSNRPFLCVNCSGLTDTLLESELFGYTRGAFTGAAGDRAGFFEAADGGTLFLDELASTSPAFQASLLRVLQSGEVRRIGSTQPRHVDVRVIGASNAPLRGLVEAGSFRSDLFYRLCVLTIELPPLRSRAGDVEVLTGHFLQRFGDPAKMPLHLTNEARAALCSYDFPGNVRELENALRRAVALSSNGLITADCLPSEIAGAGESPGSHRSAEQRLIADRPSMEELQRRYLEFILDETGWNRRQTAAVLHLDRRTIRRLIARYKLQGLADAEGDAEEDIENTK